jgi:hypothetical protein
VSYIDEAFRKAPKTVTVAAVAVLAVARVGSALGTVAGWTMNLARRAVETRPKFIGRFVARHEESAETFTIEVWRTSSTASGLVVWEADGKRKEKPVSGVLVHGDPDVVAVRKVFERIGVPNLELYEINAAVSV